MDDIIVFLACERNDPRPMQESAYMTAKWMEDNYMKLSKEKCKEMIISIAKKYCNFRNHIPNIKIVVLIIKL